MKEKMLGILSIVVVLISGILVYSPQTDAAVFRSGDSIIINENETLNESLVVSGQDIRVQGIINGDVYCAGQTVTVSGTINGDLLCGAQTITVDGVINGNIRAASQTLVIESEVARNILYFGQSLTLQEEASVSGELLGGFQTALLNGAVGKEINAGAQQFTINGSAGNNVELELESLTVGPNASIAGDLIYTSPNEADIASQGAITGEIQRKQPPIDRQQAQEEAKEFIGAAWIASKIYSILAFLAIGLLIMLLAPNTTRAITDVMQRQTLATILVGFLILIVTPILIIFLLVTIIGIPIAVILGLLYIILLVVSRIFAGILVGRLLINRFGKPKKNQSLFLPTVIGIIALWILFAIPIIGWVASFVAMLWGLGGIFYHFKSLRKA